MKELSQKHNWLIDAVLFGVFILSFFLDLTGLPLHQWLGLAVGALALYHLARHWRWVVAVGLRLSERMRGRAGWYFIIDFGLLFGFASILGSGLLISTWLDLAWIDVNFVWTYHVVTALLTLGLLLVKIGLHARWIMNTAREYVFAVPRAAGEKNIAVPQAAGEKNIAVPQAAGERSATTADYARGRREFLKLMGAVGAVSLIAIAKGASSLGLAQESQATAGGSSTEGMVNTQTPAAVSTQASAPNSASSPAVQSTSTPAPSATAQAATQESPQSSSGSLACSVRCRKGCSYPGHCGRYIDANNNGKCDNGECL